MNRRAILSILAAALVLGAMPLAVQAADNKQPIFLMSPHKKKYSAWSVYVVADPANPAKIASLGLDKLKGQNSEDNANGFDGVWKAQFEAGTERESLGTLDAAEFGRGKIEIQKDDALKLSMEAAGEDYKLIISMRCTSDKRFEVGGKYAKIREILVKLDKASGKWYAHANLIKNINEETLVGPPGAPILGITFPVTGTGIYRIVGVMKDGEQVLFVDGWRKD